MKQHYSFAFAACLLLLSALLLVACGGSSVTTATVVEDPALTGNTWQLTALNGVNTSTDSPAILAFGQANTLIGTTGCNLFSGSYLLGEQGRIDLEPTVTSAVDCSDPLKLQDEAMVMVLSNASGYEVEGETLQISNPDASLQAAFVKITPPSLAGSSWVLNSYNDGQGAIVSPVEGSQVTAEFGADGNLTGSAGCNQYSATYEDTGSTVTIGPPTTTRMMCSEPEGVMEQETNYLAAIQKAGTYRNLGIALVFYDQADQPLVTYFGSALIAGE